jgi:hypothetical protein
MELHRLWSATNTANSKWLDEGWTRKGDGSLRVARPTMRPVDFDVAYEPLVPLSLSLLQLSLSASFESVATSPRLLPSYLYSFSHGEAFISILRAFAFVGSCDAAVCCQSLICIATNPLKALSFLFLLTANASDRWRIL